MGERNLVLWLLLLGALIPQACCQHWSFGLSPGGKRAADGLSETLESIVEDLPKMDGPCSLYDCTKVWPNVRLYRLRTLLAGLTEKNSGRQNI
ncbi:progonadoliberin-1-like [Osmerus eperlanus]|uniref:progonadoliberin-1-like n=1 Tax=Osmerus eperlanus TaxID=29151 RepID=UPI002E11295C